MRDGSDTNVPDGPAASGAPTGSLPVEAVAAGVIAAERVARAHLAHELHDVPVQALSAAQWQLEAMAGEIDEPLRTRLQGVATSLAGAQRYLRELMASLDPPGLASDGLAVAIADLLEETYGPSALATFDARGLTEPPAGTASVAFRVVHDALTHRRATPAGSAGGPTIVLRDDGDGVLLRLDDPVHPDDPDDLAGSPTAGTGAALAVAVGGWWRRGGTGGAAPVTRTECRLPRW